MDQKRLPLFIAISLMILVLSEWLLPHPKHQPPPTPAPMTASGNASNNPGSVKANTPTSGAIVASAAVPANVPRVAIDAPRMTGTVSLTGARIDDLRLRDYHETVDQTSPLVRTLAPAGETDPSYVQFGWTGADGIQVPDNTTPWAADHDTLSQTQPITLSWDNGHGLIFTIALSVDENFEFTARQGVRNTTTKPVSVFPWQRIRRDYTPQTSGYSVLFEGMLGVGGNRLNNLDYKAAAKEAKDKPDGLAYQFTGNGGWAGFTDKYWLTVLIPDQAQPVTTNWYHLTDNATDHFQVSYIARDAQTIAAGASVSATTRVFSGAKEVRLLDRYETRETVPMLSYAVDWGWFFFITKPFFYAIDFLNELVGNFGVAILIFTVVVKAAFFPLASTSYRSMAKMRILAPKIQAARERYKDDPPAQQKAMMEIYKVEKVNPASGCLPMVIQIPVFFSLYKVILVTIEMRHAPFFGWIRDLSSVDPTNVFNLFGLIPFDPSIYSHYLHLGVWPLAMGVTMWFQQKLNPPPPDPAQARMLQFMPIIFTFMMGSFPAGLVIYWTWNNALTIAQQTFIQRQAMRAAAARG